MITVQIDIRGGIIRNDGAHCQGHGGLFFVDKIGRFE
jgi:hypothetical protein